jgi:Kef-type K+ transport system membrane component KefB
MQDLAVVPLLALVPILADAGRCPGNAAVAADWLAVAMVAW